MKTRTLVVLALALGSERAGLAQHPAASCAAHQSAVNERGDHVMGFDHAKTTHHFGLNKSGGLIEVSANDAKDAESRDAIRGHLAHIAKMFAAGDFQAPMLIHDRVPPGVPTLKRKRALVHWDYEDTALGGRIVISSADRKARSAIHDFLRFQIEDHKTGDSEEISE